MCRCVVCENTSHPTLHLKSHYSHLEDLFDPYLNHNDHPPTTQPLKHLLTNSPPHIVDFSPSSLQSIPYQRNVTLNSRTYQILDVLPYYEDCTRYHKTHASSHATYTPKNNPIYTTQSPQYNKHMITSTTTKTKGEPITNVSLQSEPPHLPQKLIQKNVQMHPTSKRIPTYPDHHKQQPHSTHNHRHKQPSNCNLKTNHMEHRTY